VIKRSMTIGLVGVSSSRAARTGWQQMLVGLRLPRKTAPYRASAEASSTPGRVGGRLARGRRLGRRRTALPPSFLMTTRGPVPATASPTSGSGCLPCLGAHRRPGHSRADGRGRRAGLQRRRPLRQGSSWRRAGTTSSIACNSAEPARKTANSPEQAFVLRVHLATGAIGGLGPRGHAGRRHCVIGPTPDRGAAPLRR
jgi:hypothetical protein